VTGSDLRNLQEQVPAAVLLDFAGFFTCSGNEMHKGGRRIHAMQHAFPDELAAFAEAWIGQAKFLLRTGRHVEARTGTLNVSVVGRNARRAERAGYHRHDIETGERLALARAISARFPDYEVRLGGQISVDVSPRGWNKGRVVGEILSRHPEAAIAFFGDNTGKNGNDEPVVEALRDAGPDHRVHAVASYRETLAILMRDYCGLAEAERVA
jgi:hydroxymethylpyrimidine pyrophosphatase-like HAD family hydrolase